MNDDVSEEMTFSALFPLPFRALFLGGLGILGWATNLHGLEALGIDAGSALELSTHLHHHQRLTSSSLSSRTDDTPLPTTKPPPTRGWRSVGGSGRVYMPVYRLFGQYTLATLVAWALYRNATHGDIELVDVFKFIPAVTMLALLMVLVAPFNVAEKRERDKFMQCVLSLSSPARPRRPSPIPTDERARHGTPVLPVRYIDVSSRGTGYISQMSCLRISSLPSQKSWVTSGSPSACSCRAAVCYCPQLNKDSRGGYYPRS